MASLRGYISLDFRWGNQSPRNCISSFRKQKTACRKGCFPLPNLSGSAKGFTVVTPGPLAQLEASSMRVEDSAHEEPLSRNLTQPSQLRTIFGVFAISFAVKLRVSIAQL